MRLKKYLLSVGLAAAGMLSSVWTARATTCANAIAITGNSVTNQAVVCGTTNDIATQPCGTTSYDNGLEALYVWTPTASGVTTISINGASWTGIFVFQGCPTTTGTTCVGSITSSATSKSVNVTVTAGTQYYVMFDTWPTPNSPCEGAGSTFSITAPVGCSGAPTPGTASATVASTCPGGSSVLSVTGQQTTGGATGQWQASTTSATSGFTNISGATGTSYTTPALSSTTYYRHRVLCPFTNDSAFSNVITVTVTAPPVTPVGLPYFQDFDNWLSTCGNADRPGAEWTTTPFSGNNSWRRDDQGATGAWTSITSGAPGNFSAADTNYARFHSWSTSAQGSMMLNMNLSATGPKLISFDYINTSGTDSLFVELSTDGGTNYTVLGAFALAASWQSRNVATTSTAASAIIRFRAKGDAGSTDIGLDNLNIAVVTCPPPGNPTAASVTATSASISWPAAALTPSLGYYFEVRTSGAGGSGATGLFTSGFVSNTTTSVFVAGLSGQTTYNVFVRAVCSSTDSSAYAAGSFSTLINCNAAINISACGVSTTATIAPGTGYYNPVVTATGTAPFGTPGREEFYTFTPPITGVYTLNVTAASGGYVDYFVKPTSASGACGNTGWIYWDDVNAPGTDTLTLMGGVQYYILLDPEGTGGMSQTFSIICPPTCGQPTAFSATATTTTSATFGWTQPTPGSPSQWQVSYGPTGTTAVAGTKVITSTNPYTLSGLTSGTGYVAYVRAICAPGDTSAWSASASFNTQCVASTVPFTEDFATVLPSPCWSRATGALGATSTLTATTSNAWGSKTYMNVTGNPAASINLFVASKRDWLITPSIDLGSAMPANGYVLEFNMGVTAYNSTTLDSLGVDDTVAVVYSPNNGATWSSSNILRRWTFADDTIGSQRYYIPFSGTGLVKFGFYGSEGTIDDAADNDIFFDSVRIVPCTLPVFSLGPDTAACSGASITLSASAGATGYMWSTGATTQSITVSTAGTYSVMAYNGSLGCARRDTIVVTTGTNPTVSLGADTTFCAGNSYTLNAGNPGATYLYNTGATTQTLLVSTSGQYSVRVRNAQGCVGRDTVNVTVRPLPVVNLGPDTTVCGNVASFILNAGNNPGATFSWMGSTVTAQTLNIAPILNTLNNGPIVPNTRYTAAVTVTDSIGCTSTDTIRVTVSFSPRVSDFTITGQDPTLTFTPVKDSAATSYAWSFGDGGTATSRVATRTFTSSGVYNVRLIVINSCGRDTIIKQVQVNTAGVGEVISAENITLYPNPTAGDAALKVEGDATLRSLQVFSATGALVLSEPASGSHATIRTAALAPGIYTLRIQLDKGVVVRRLEVAK